MTPDKLLEVETTLINLKGGTLKVLDTVIVSHYVGPSLTGIDSGTWSGKETPSRSLKDSANYTPVLLSVQCPSMPVTTTRLNRRADQEGLS